MTSPPAAARSGPGRQELVQRQNSLSPGVGDGDHRVEHDQWRRRIGAGRGVAAIAADGGGVADLYARDVASAFPNQAPWTDQRRRSAEIRQSRHGADMDALARPIDPREVRNRLQADDRLHLQGPFLQLEDEVGPSGQQPPIRTTLIQHLEAFRDSGRFVI